MPRTKLKKFDKLKNMTHVIQPKTEEMLSGGFYLRGKWSKKFNNTNPIILELGCGKGEYTVALAQMYPQYNYIGVDIKGARIYSGAERVVSEKLKNVVFIRTQIDYLNYIFSQHEIYEIWITFPDPQIKFHRRKKRLISPKFLQIYSHILKKEGRVHLKTDSMFLHGYALGLLESSGHNIINSKHDIYNVCCNDSRLEIKTYYEKIFLKNKQPISYLLFSFS